MVTGKCPEILHLLCICIPFQCEFYQLVVISCLVYIHTNSIIQYFNVQNGKLWDSLYTTWPLRHSPALPSTTHSKFTLMFTKMKDLTTVWLTAKKEKEHRCGLLEESVLSLYTSVNLLLWVYFYSSLLLTAKPFSVFFLVHYYNVIFTKGVLRDKLTSWIYFKKENVKMEE